MTQFRKTLTALAAVATLTVAAVATPQQAEARGGRNAAAIVGGLAVGAIIAGAASGAYGGGYGGGYGYYGRPGYYGYGPGPVYYGRRCWTERQRVFDGYGWRVQRVRVCS